MASLSEFGPSLEDVVILSSLPLFEDTHGVGMVLQVEDKEKLNSFDEALSDSRYSIN